MAYCLILIYELASFLDYCICFCFHCIHGVGGGAVLLLFLTVFSDIPLATAQGINLLFFLPIGAVALLFHQKSGLLQIKKGLSAGYGACLAFFSVYGLHLGWNLLSFPSCLQFFYFILGLKHSFLRIQKSPGRKEMLLPRILYENDVVFVFGGEFMSAGFCPWVFL